MTAFNPITLQTARLSLRFLRMDDAPALLHLFSDPEALRYWSVELQEPYANPRIATARMQEKGLTPR